MATSGAAPQASYLRRFFTGLVESVFQVRLGVVDPPLVDYLAGLLVQFVRTDDVYSLRNLSGKPLTQVADMLLEAEERVGSSRRGAYRHVGDYTLFWTGVYPKALDQMRRRHHKDHLIDYKEQGKRSYLVASAIEIDDDRAPPGELLEGLGKQFDLCAYGLNEVRKEWERRDDPKPPPVILLG